MFHSRTVVRALRSLISILAVVGLAAAPVSAQPAAPAQVKLSTAEGPAAGRQEAILSVDRFGRYSARTE